MDSEAIFMARVTITGMVEGDQPVRTVIADREVLTGLVVALGLIPAS